ncbi:cell division protein FtsZ [Aurantiacibacter suaedae]|uniref:cell division protein FtsZ n=1 Tax=Aurantiacibacter suaedae TaxID=2545755 RepID=UPI0010F7539D|nr:cell division protein FtsZ [Aurantiacibacter suaedae]
MSINIGPPSVEELRPRITVIGVGGAGGNAIANMIESEIEGVDFVVANTDAQALNNAIAEHRIQLGPDITQGLGAGSRPEVGRAAAEETVEEIERALDGVNMVFIAGGMGGGTGTGAAPVIAEVARSKGILTVGVVTKPFLFEGTRRMRAAESGIEELQKHVDTLIVIPNQNLFLVAKADTTFKEAFSLADEVLQQGVRSITDLMVMPGLINLDFADVRSVMNEMGKAMMGTGEGEGENRALEAAERAIANPLLDGVSMQGAKGVIISIIGGEDMRLLEVDEAANHIRELVDPEANIIWGSAFNPDLEGKIRVSVVATGIEQTGDSTARAASRPLDLSTSRGPKTPMAGAGAVAPAAFDDGDEAKADTGASQAPDRDDLRNAEPEQPLPEPMDLAGLEEAEEPQDNAGAAQQPQRFAPFDRGAGAHNDRSQPQDSAEEQDELLLDSSRQADDGDGAGMIGRRRNIAAGEEGSKGEAGTPGTSDRAPRAGSAGASGGSTLFERMANLSRGSADESESDDDDGEDGGPNMRIPRFLGRQNNQ